MTKSVGKKIIVTYYIFILLTINIDAAILAKPEWKFNENDEILSILSDGQKS